MWRAHSVRLAEYAARVQSVYDTLNEEIAKAVLNTGYNGNVPFKFSDYPQTKRQFDNLRLQFVTDMRSVIMSSTSEEWKQSNLVQDLLADKVLRFYGIKKNDKKYRIYYQSNNDALKAFQERKDKGLSLSEKLWNQSSEYKEEMEFCLSSAIEKGTGAVKLSKRLSKYLVDFPSLKRDYKERFGRAVNCKDCEYRSIRLARTEINMAYRTAEQERWRQFDFVLGYEVKLTQNGLHVPDVCDDLAGKFPKDFVFRGWHPNCLCYCIPILKTEEQFFNDEDASEIMVPPQDFLDWIDDNADRIGTARDRGTLPHWYTENAQFVNTTRWRNWYSFAEDDYLREEYVRIMKWKEPLGLDVRPLENLLLMEKPDKWDYYEEIENLRSKINEEKDQYLDQWNSVREMITSKDFQEKYDRGFVKKVRSDFYELNPHLSYDAKTQWSELQNIGNMIKEYEAYLTDGLVAPVRPSFALKSADKDVVMSNPSRVLGQLDALLGTTRQDHFGFLAYRNYFANATDSGTLDKWVKSDFLNFIKSDAGAVFSSIDHLNEIANAADLQKIPKRWWRTFNKYMQDIRAYDIEANGYGGVYNQIEAAYNIYKLSTIPAATKYGLSKVSEKMPWNLFDVFQEKRIDLKYLPSSNFFKYEGDFIPWYDLVQFPGNALGVYNQAYYSPKFGHVAINRDYFDQSFGRAAENAYETQQVFYHEYGHALDWQRGWRHKKKIGELFDKYAAKYADMDACDLFEKFHKAYNDVRDTEYYISNGEILSGLPEQGASLSDFLQSVRKDNLKVMGGHPDTYFMGIDNDGNHYFKRGFQLTEFIAHMNECFWLYNDVWRAFDEEFYKEMKSIMRKAYRGSSGTLD